MKSTKQPSDPWTRFALSIFKLNGLIIQAGEGIAGPLGQTSARWQVLGRAYEPQTVAKMARDMGHARQSVQRIADVLVKEGLIIYKDNPGDQRAHLVELTPKGMKTLTAIYQRQLEWSQRVMAKLESQQLATIADSLQVVEQVLEGDANTNLKETT